METHRLFVTLPTNYVMRIAYFSINSFQKISCGYLKEPSGNILLNNQIMSLQNSVNKQILVIYYIS